MSAEITCSAFEETVRAAVLQRSARYTDSHSLTLRWEGDDTGASQDAGRFQNLLALFNLPPATELTINANDNTPGWTVQSTFTQILTHARSTRGRALVMVHYAGHGFVNKDSVFYFSEGPGGRHFNAELFLTYQAGPDQYYLHDSTNVDVLFIFDCCYGFTACRAAEVIPRIVEFIAATDSSSPLAFSPPRITVTAKLISEIRRRQREGHRYVEFADVVATLRANESAVKKPTHYLKMGAASICLPFSGLLAVDPSSLRPTLRAVFSVHIADNMTQHDVDQFVAWIRGLPEYAAITLEGIYPTGSQLLILSSNWSVWSKIAGMRGYKLIAETRGGNTLHTRQLPAPPSPLKENIPFGKQFR
ncbi:uncharacterized protein BJX67DRAFT_5979 [Aspergillus lucknowensis]|uniref:Caspase domain-containing protein n=1 Tax=Aspergillus lucknowensis TaxID=176173 RepID=A0ABR4M717_9EURO